MVTTDEYKAGFLVCMVIYFICLAVVSLSGGLLITFTLLIGFLARYLSKVLWPETIEQQYVYFKDKHEKLDANL